MKVIRFLLYYLLAANALPGIWALFFPHQFYTSFPGLGFHWVDIMGPYHDHLIRDVGAFFCSLAFLSVYSLIRTEHGTVKITAIANVVFGVPHLIYHLYMIDMFPTMADKFFGILALLLTTVVAGVILWMTQTDKKPSIF